MAAHSFLLLCLTQIAEHKLVNVLSHGRIELIFDYTALSPLLVLIASNSPVGCISPKK